MFGDGQGGKSTNPQELLWEFALRGQGGGCHAETQCKAIFEGVKLFLLNEMHKIRIMG